MHIPSIKLHAALLQSHLKRSSFCSARCDVTQRNSKMQVLQAGLLYGGCKYSKVRFSSDVRSVVSIASAMTSWK